MLVRFAQFPFETLFEDFPGVALTQRSARFPALDMTEDDKQFVVAAALPGVAKEDLKIRILEGTLHISGDRKQTGIPEDSRWIRNEVGSGEFSRAIEFPTPLKEDAVSAELKDGILRIVLPKADDARPREIAVK